MAKAKIFKSGNGQAVRLHKKFQFDVKEIEIFRRGDEVVLRKTTREPTRNLLRTLKALQSMPADFFAGGLIDLTPEGREGL